MNGGWHTDDVICDGDEDTTANILRLFSLNSFDLQKWKRIIHLTGIKNNAKMVGKLIFPQMLLLHFCPGVLGTVR